MEKLLKLFEAAYSYIPKIGIVDIIELIIMCYVIYKILVLMKNTRAWVFVKGILVLLIFYAFADVIGFNVIKVIFQSLFSVLAILMVILFQQELKKLIGEIGKRGSIWTYRKKKDKEYDLLSETQMDAIVTAVKDMAAVKTGALILIERDIPLKEWSDTGIPVNANITRQMLVQIFEKNTPLHDGAVIIRDGRIESATCYLPLSKNEEVNKALGTRHRAGIGISEVTDALVIIVSEETGKISTVLNGDINHGTSVENLRKTLTDIQKANIEIKKKNPFKDNMKIKAAAVIATAVLWTVLTNITDPVITRTIYDIPITIQNEKTITGKGLSYHIDNEDNVDIILKGKKSVVNNMKSDDIHAYADLKNLSISNATEIIAWSSIQNVELIPKTKMLNITVEDTKEVDYDISVETTGTLSSFNYINSIILNKPNVKISGPVSKIDIIGNVSASFNITNASDNSKLSAPIKVYDKNGEEMTDDVILSYDTAEATVDMYETKTVPLTISVQCLSDSGEILEYTYNKDEITIAAEKITLDAINTMFMEVPITIDDTVDTSEFVKVINISDFMPKDVYLAEKEQKLSININYEKYVEMNITMQPESINLINKNDNYKYTIEPLTVTVKGLRKDIETLQLTCEADVSEFDLGTHQIPVIFNSQYVHGDFKASIKVSGGK